MKTIFTFIVLLASCFAQVGGGAKIGGGGKLSNVGSSGGITAGDGIICEYAFDPAASFTSITDTLNGTFTVAVAATSIGSPVSSLMGVVVFPNSAHGATDTITLATGGPTPGFGVLQCQAYKNVKATSPTDATAVPVLVTSTPNPTSPNVTTTVDGDLIISDVVMAAQTPTAGNGTLVDSNNYISAPEYRVQATHGASTNNTYTASSDSWASPTATFFNNGSTISLDSTCHALSQTIVASHNIVVTISC